MTREGTTDHGRSGQQSLTAGAIALGAAFVPVVGDLIAVPAAVLAIVLGGVGLRHYEQGRTARVVPAILGTALGLAAVLGVALVALAAR